MSDESDSTTAHPLDVRHENLAALVPEIYKTSHERLACELALAGPMCVAPAEIFARYGYSEDAACLLLDHPAFKVLLARVDAEIRESGLSFKLKAGAIAEDLLPVAYEMALDPCISSAVRMDGIKWLAKMGGREPKDEKDGVKGGGFNLSITFAGHAPVKIIEAAAVHEPALIEQGE